MSTSDKRFDWRRVKWHPGLGRGGFVPRWVERLSLKKRTAMCRRSGHPLEAIEPMTWEVAGERVPGHMCARCYGSVDLSRLLSPAASPSFVGIIPSGQDIESSGRLRIDVLGAATLDEKGGEPR